MLHLISFADENYTNAGLQLIEESKNKKCFKTIKVYGNNWWKKNKGNSDEEKCKLGNGYWVWKPKIINERLNDPDIKMGDVIVYIDAGKSLIDSKEKIERVAYNTKDIQYSSTGYKEINWTMKKVWDYFNMDIDTKLYQASAHNIIVRKTPNTLYIINELANTKPYYFGIFDSNKQCGEFIEHRHDQSLFSMLMHKYNIKATRNFLSYKRNDEAVNTSWLNTSRRYKLYNVSEQWWTHEYKMKNKLSSLVNLGE